jgi:hypothetical protein
MRYELVFNCRYEKCAIRCGWLDTFIFSSSDFSGLSKIKMDKSEQRILIKYFSMKGLGSRLIHNELQSVLRASVYSLSGMEKWVSRFKTGLPIGEDNPRPGRPPSDLGSSLAAFLLKFPFASARQMSKHFHASLTTNKKILSRQLGPRKLSRRRVPHRLSDDQKAARVRDSRALLAILRRVQDNSFEGIPRGDESWFLYEYQTNSIFAASRETVSLTYEHKIQAKKTLITVFFTSTRLLVLAALPYDQTSTSFIITQIHLSRVCFVYHQVQD